MSNKEKLSFQKWHNMTIEDTIAYLGTDSANGLSFEKAKQRLQEYGQNVLPEKKKTNVFIRFARHFHDMLIYMLLAAALITLYLGHYVDTSVILIVTVVNAAIGFFQERKAEQAMLGIKNMLSLKANVIRDGRRQEIASSELVVGDLVVLSPGDKIPADLRVIKAENLTVEESALTGESTTVQKSTFPVSADTALADKVNIAFSGTTVRAGTGLGIVTATGVNTEIGKINSMISNVEETTTPLLKQITSLGKTISIVIILISVSVFVFSYLFRDYEVGELLLAVIGLAVAAIPEGLPAIMSIILSLGIQNMAKRKAIIRDLPSVETLGSVSVICSDKTGTLTKNEMTVKTVIAGSAEYQVSGTGYKPEGKLSKDQQEINLDQIASDHEQTLRKMLVCLKVCNDSRLSETEGTWTVNGDPTEGALLTVYEKASMGIVLPERKATIPFDSEYKYMATLSEYEGEPVIYIKGAPDRLFEMACCQATDAGETAIDYEYWKRQIKALADNGQRVLGAAYKKIPSGQHKIGHVDVQADVVFLGVVGIMDPPRPEAIAAIQECREAGIQVKMITGDHIDTAKAIGKEMGIGDGTNALEGKQIDDMDEQQLRKAALEYDVFARTSPKHKLMLVQALQNEGKICAMTGDGVNDAPALKKADVGIAMGIKGTEVTKEAAEIVLADDNFKTIVNAVEEGRRVYDNLKKTILFILPTNGAESFLIIASLLFGTIMPLIPVQILWVNMVTSVTISLALAFEPMEEGAMKRPPRNPKEPLFSRYFMWRILFVSILIGGGTLLMNIQLLAAGYDQELVRTLTLQTIVIAQMFHLFNSRSIRGCAFGKGFFANKAIFIVSAILLCLQLSITYIPFMNEVFSTRPLMLEDWIYPILIGVAVFVIIEIEKFIMRIIYGDK